MFTPAELLAAVPAVGSIGCLVAAHRRGQARWLVGAGLLAVTAALIKQSFLDAGFAGAVFLVASSVRDRRPRLRWAAAYAAGALIPLVAVAAWLLAGARLAPGASSTRSSASGSTRCTRSRPRTSRSTIRVHSLLAPGRGLRPLRRARRRARRPRGRCAGDRVLAVTLAAWLAAGAVGVLGGGSYWPHYLIQLVAPASLLAGAALARAPRAGPRRGRRRPRRARVVGTVGACRRCARTTPAQRRPRRGALRARPRAARRHAVRHVRPRERGLLHRPPEPVPVRLEPPGPRAPRARCPASCTSCGRRGARPGSSAGSAPTAGSSTRAGAIARALHDPLPRGRARATATRSTTALVPASKEPP